MCSIAFVPPLLQRKDPVQSCFHSKYIDMDKPTCYFEKIIKQRFIICKVSETDQIVAFMTFIDNYKCKEMLDIGASNYITTLCVQKENRRKGILKKMYEYILTDLPDEFKNRHVSTRTWSTNTAHIKTLIKFGFVQVAFLKDHREKGIDTIYYAKKIQTL